MQNSNQDQNLIQLIDENGNEVLVTREQWANQMLPENFRACWDHADDLYELILGAFEDGFDEQALEPSKRLYDIDHDRVRGTATYAIALLNLGRLDESEDVLNLYIKEHGDEGYIIVNLAKVHAEKGHQAEAEKLLWKSIEMDPNIANAVEWYAAIAYENGGDSEYVKALKDIAMLEGSWCAQLWLAENELQKDQINNAIEYYKDALSKCRPVKEELLLQISGDLGQNGYIQEIIDLCAPFYNEQQYGLNVGNNLIKAYIDLEDYAKAQAIVDNLEKMSVLPWKEAIDFWKNELANLAK